MKTAHQGGVFPSQYQLYFLKSQDKPHVCYLKQFKGNGNSLSCFESPGVPLVTTLREVALAWHTVFSDSLWSLELGGGMNTITVYEVII